MMAIRKEISAVHDGLWPADDNPLVNAPHAAQSTADCSKYRAGVGTPPTVVRKQLFLTEWIRERSTGRWCATSIRRTGTVARSVRARRLKNWPRCSDPHAGTEIPTLAQSQPLGRIRNVTHPSVTCATRFAAALSPGRKWHNFAASSRDCSRDVFCGWGEPR